MPVHLKGGLGDVVLYRATMVLTMLGKSVLVCYDKNLVIAVSNVISLYGVCIHFY